MARTPLSSARYRIAAAGAALALLLPHTEPAIASGQAQAPATGTGVVAGQVIDVTTKQPVGGAVVTLSLGALPAAPTGAVVPPPAPVATRRGVAVANADGRFVFRDVPAGTFSLAATRNGYASGAFGRRRPNGPSRTFALADGARITDALVPIWRLGAIAGTILDDRGEPLVGVIVSASRRTTLGGRDELAWGSGNITDDRGRYRVTRLLPGSYVISVPMSTKSAAESSVDRYRAAIVSGTTAAITNEWRLTGVVEFATEGIVVDGWQVSVSSGLTQPRPGPGGTLLIHPMTFHGNTSSPADATTVALAAGEVRTGVDVALPLIAGVRVAGVLNGPSGPAANHGVQLVRASASEPFYGNAVAYSTTDAAGRFAFLGIAPGSYVVRARRAATGGPNIRFEPPAAGGLPITTVETVRAPAVPPPALFAEAPVSVGSAHVDGLSVTLQPGARLTGRVVFDGAATAPTAAQLQQITVSMRPLTGTVPGADTRVDSAGVFLTAGYPPGRYLLSATAPAASWTLASVRVGDVDAADQAMTLGTSDVNDVVVTFTDKVMTLSGTVRSDVAGDVDATVVVFPADVRAWLVAGMSARRVMTATTSAAGAYQVRIATMGDYMVVALPPDVEPEVDSAFASRYAATAVRITFAPGETRTQALTVSRPR